MCGIFGSVSAQLVDSEWSGATDVLIHRGPDSGGYYKSPDGRVFLGHRRLSIIDCSDTANQPMYSADGNYVIIFNGEVYNFRELRNRLPGFSWKTGSDTEVILELFACFGPESVTWLNGIFAFAVYDVHSEKLWLTRDPLGVKPLYVRRNSEGLTFASELKAIIAADQQGTGAPGASPRLSIEGRAVPLFLHLGYIPEPYTIYEGIEKFPAGCCGVYEVRSAAWEQSRYWNATDFYLTNPITDEAAATGLYREKLFAAVERQMISDVPLGTFLSGGVDSSLVTAVASQISPQRVKTFSIGFEEATFDESVYAGKVAAHLNTDHHLFRVKEQDVLDLVPQFISVFDEPFADSSAFPTMLVSRLARQHVTVTLSGDGGDELFQGYGMYAWAQRLEHPAVKLLRRPLHWAGRFMNQRYQRAALLFDYPHPTRIPGHIFSQEQYLFSEHELRRLLIRPDFDFSTLNQLPAKGIAPERQAFWDLEHYLKDDLLVKVDRASMRYSLEARVPLLDRELVEFSLNLPYGLKMKKDYGTKYLMKKVLYELIPRSLFERPKRGFAIPLHKWLQGELKPLIEKYLDEEQVQSAGLVHIGYVRSLLQDYRGGKSFLYNRVWALLVLHWWYAIAMEAAD